eukprot:1293776-Heterocapsa_arctica.AAC.1
MYAAFYRLTPKERTRPLLAGLSALSFRALELEDWAIQWSFDFSQVIWDTDIQASDTAHIR